MAARPLPPGRRGGRLGPPRAASGLQRLPEPKLLDLPPPAAVTPESPQPAAAPPAPEVSTTSSRSETPTHVAQVIAALEHHAAEPARPTSPAARFGVQAAKLTTPAVSPPLVSAPPVASSASAPVVSAPPVPVHRPETPPAPALAVYQPLEVLAAPPAPPVVATPPTSTVAAAPTPKEPVAAVPAIADIPRVPTPPASGDSVDVELGEFHPFRLLLPVESVPPVPESLECVYDDAAAEMQKNVLRALKKALGKKHKAKIEDFKINSRLFGNNFMESGDYFDALVQDLGGVRALQLAPCLVMIQPDYMKRSGLLLAARNYRARHFAALEAQCEALRAVAAPPAPAPTPVAPATPAQVPSHAQPADHAATPQLDADHATASPPLGLLPAAGSAAAALVAASAAEAVGAEVGSDSVETLVMTDSAAEKESREESAVEEDIAASDVDVVSAAVMLGAAAAEAGARSFENLAIAQAVVAEQTSPIERPVDAADSASSVMLPTESLVEPAVGVESDAPADFAKEPTPVPCDLIPTESTKAEEEEVPVPVAAATSVVGIKDPATASARASATEPREPPVSPPADVFVADLPLAFQHLFSSDEVVVPAQSPPSTAVSRVTSARDDTTNADNLFGERLSTGSASSDNADNLFGESYFEPKSSTAAAAAGSNPPPPSGSASKEVPGGLFAPKSSRSQLLFGFATAGADTDSDSDDSDFSSS